MDDPFQILIERVNDYRLAHSASEAMGGRMVDYTGVVNDTYVKMLLATDDAEKWIERSIFYADVNKAARNLTMRVRFTGERRFAAKVWIAVRLVRLAAWIMGVGIQVDMPPVERPASGGR